MDEFESPKRHHFFKDLAEVSAELVAPRERTRVSHALLIRAGQVATFAARMGITAAKVMVP